MPLVSTELNEAEIAKLKADQITMGAADLGLVIKAALQAFTPAPHAATPPAQAATEATSAHEPPAAAGEHH
jgi:hypothetical protein